MASVIASKVGLDIPQADGRRYVAYRVVVEDNHARTHVVRVGPKLVPPEFDAAADLLAEEGRLLAWLARQDIEAAIREMEQGRNPLRDQDGNLVVPPFAEYSQVVSSALRHFLSHDDPAVAVHALPYIDNLTDDQIMALLPCDAAMVTSIRALADSWRATHDNIAAYTPLLQE